MPIKLIFLISFLLNITLLIYIFQVLSLQKRNIVLPVVHSCEQLAQNYAALKKIELTSIPSASKKYSDKENAQHLFQRQRFQSIFTRIIDLCELELTNIPDYRRLTGDTSEME